MAERAGSFGSFFVDLDIFIAGNFFPHWYNMQCKKLLFRNVIVK